MAPMKPSPELVAAFAPTGALRVVINLGNPVLANRGADGQPGGVTVDSRPGHTCFRLDLPAVVPAG